MQNAILIGLSRQTALQRNLDIISHNLANMETVAYKAERPLFRTHLTSVQDVNGNADKARYVSDYGMVRNVTEGTIRRTGNPLDVAIDGPGYFAVSTPGGERYTRNGQLRIDDEGTLVTSDGQPVLDTNRNEIIFGPDEDSLSIARDGSISTTAGQKGVLLVVTFENESNLTRTGGSLYVSTAPPIDRTDAVIQQGSIEESNVIPILEMSTMLEVLRAYSSTSQLVKSAEELNQRAIRTLGQAQ